MKGFSVSSLPVASRLAAMILLFSLLAGCSFGRMPTAVPEVDTAPTFQAVQTEAALTVVAELTRTAPSATPEVIQPEAATETPLPEPSATTTATLVVLPPTPTATNTLVPATLAPTLTSTPVNTGCTIVEQSPAFGADFSRNGDFDGNWKVKNIGVNTWSASAVDIKYIAGTKFQTKVDALDLPVDVAVNDTYTVIIDMRAPDATGRYSTTWAVVQGSATLCTLNLTIDVLN